MQIPDKDKDRLDFWLDTALRQQGNAEPRVGLENRLLSKLHTRKGHIRAIRQWGLILGGPALAVLLIALVWRGERTGAKPPDMNAGHAISQAPPIAQALGAKPQPSMLPGVRNSKQAAATQRRTLAQSPRSEPRLDRFPSSRPLSSQEVVIARYAEHYPREAALIAKEQEEFNEEVQKAQKDIEAGSAISSE
jgi:hypothetical protein